MLASGERSVLPHRVPARHASRAIRDHRPLRPMSDGVSVPVTVIRHRDVPLDGTAPCLLYGYGAWEHVIHPAVDPVLLSMLDRGVVFAQAHVRGGGELGRAWWRAGRMARKQQTFSDFIAVADALGAGVVDPRPDRGARPVGGRAADGRRVQPGTRPMVRRGRGGAVRRPGDDDVRPGRAAGHRGAREWGDPRREADLRWMLGWSPYDNVPPAGSGRRCW